MRKVDRKNIFSKNERGSAIVIALLILTLLTAFVALAVTRTTHETIATSNDAAESRAFAASQASLEIMTRNFDKIFEEKLSPAPADLTKVESLKPPGFETEYDFKQTIVQTGDTVTKDMTGGLYQGLKAVRDEWQVDSTATDLSTGVQVALQRKFYNNRIPIFQFGIFYNDDLEFHPGPRFDFGGRVHSNGNLFMMAQDGLYFSSRVSAVGHVITDIGRNGTANSSSELTPKPKWGDKVYIKNAAGTYVRLQYNMGSVLNKVVNGPPVFNDPAHPELKDTDMPAVYRSADWASNKEAFGGNLLAEQKRLDLPIASRVNGSLNYIELIKRGRNVGDLWNDGTSVKAVTTDDEDSTVTVKERYANKKGLRISLADSRAKLPGCATKTSDCGIRLDADDSGDGSEPGSGEARGYQPRKMRDADADPTNDYKATRINGERFYHGITGRGTWIKIELVSINAATNKPSTDDVTEDILSLGVTEPAPCIFDKLKISNPSNYYNKCTSTGYEPFIDSRSIVKLQRFVVPGVGLTASDTTYSSYIDFGGTSYNVVVAGDRPSKDGKATGTGTWTNQDTGALIDKSDHYKILPGPASGTGVERRIVPFPIQMFDTREGVYNFKIDFATKYPNSGIPWAGVMSMIDIDVENLRKFLNGDFNSSMPLGTLYANAKSHELRHSDVPEANGWVLYISDRRGDEDFDGMYDMEDVYGENDGVKQPGEDVNFNNKLDIPSSYASSDEAVKYTGTGSYDSPAKAATIDHKYYRRGVRLINGKTLPGKYDSSNSLNTKGFTVASENGVYVLGNYNATGIIGTTYGTPTASTIYAPQGGGADGDKHIPASVVADAVTILSNAWQDSRSFRYPYSSADRTATPTFVRFAMLTGDSRSSYEASPNQGDADIRLCGGVHNFKRFLEKWASVRLNYCGSIINLFNAQNNNGSYKNSTVVYEPPNRDWVFDTSFLEPSRLPPGTPFFQNIQLTGFQRVN